jgi:dipeptidyl aminopeptidase/acylaminoacyl peptidase
MPTGTVIRDQREVVFTNEMRTILKEKLTPEQFSLITSISEAVVVRRIRYAVGNDRTSVGFIVEPKEAKRPLSPIVFLRGGYKDFSMWRMYGIYSQLGRLALLGYSVIATQYAGNDGADGKDEYGGMDLEDVLVLKDVVNELPGVIPEIVGVIGASRGGLMALMAACRATWVSNLFLISPVTDAAALKNGRPEFAEVFMEAFGDTEKGIEERSPVSWVHELPKGLTIEILHGDADVRVSVSQTRAFVSAARSTGLKISYQEVVGGDHFLASHERELWVAIERWAKGLAS